MVIEDSKNLSEKVFERPANRQAAETRIAELKREAEWLRSILPDYARTDLLALIQQTRQEVGGKFQTPGILVKADECMTGKRLGAGENAKIKGAGAERGVFLDRTGPSPMIYIVNGDGQEAINGWKAPAVAMISGIPEGYPGYQPDSGGQEIMIVLGSWEELEAEDVDIGLLNKVETFLGRVKDLPEREAEKPENVRVTEVVHAGPKREQALNELIGDPVRRIVGSMAGQTVKELRIDKVFGALKDFNNSQLAFRVISSGGQLRLEITIVREEEYLAMFGRFKRGVWQGKQPSVAVKKTMYVVIPFDDQNGEIDPTDLIVSSEREETPSREELDRKFPKKRHPERYYPIRETMIGDVQRRLMVLPVIRYIAEKLGSQLTAR